MIVSSDEIAENKEEKNKAAPKVYKLTSDNYGAILDKMQSGPSAVDWQSSSNDDMKKYFQKHQPLSLFKGTELKEIVKYFILKAKSIGFKIRAYVSQTKKLIQLLSIFWVQKWHISHNKCNQMS